jgi:hypothetical protein
MRGGPAVPAERVIWRRAADEFLLADEFRSDESCGFAPCPEVREIDIGGDVAAAGECVEIMRGDRSMQVIAAGRALGAAVVDGFR